MHPKKFLAEVSLWLLFLVCWGIPSSGYCTEPPTLYRVLRVVDGDTLDVQEIGRVRLIGIDAPETHFSEKLQRQARLWKKSESEVLLLGTQATQQTKKLLEGQKVRLVLGPEAQDDYGRVLAFVYFSREKNQVEKILRGKNPGKKTGPVEEFFLNQLLVQHGFAEALTRYPFPDPERFSRWQQEAQHKKLGLWKN